MRSCRVIGYTKRLFSSVREPVKTALYDLHVKKGGKVVDFAGFYLPVQYENDSITNSHLFTRKSCSLFDVSHMLQTKIHGRDRAEFIERITTADVRGLKHGKSCLTVFTDKDTGGILDDLIVTNAVEDYLYVVSNAGRREHDMNLMVRTQEAMQTEKKDVVLEFLDLAEVSLVALQGPLSAAILQTLSDVSLDKIPFMSSTEATLGGTKCRVTRCGYTGEDGFEISVPSDRAEQLVEMLLADERVKLAGLGARDSLRLEAGLCLYGSDIDTSVTPVEASLAWLVAKVRRERKDFPGVSVIMKQLAEGVPKKRVGLKVEKGPPARHDCSIINQQGQVIGKVTSGCPSPSLGGSVAMGYVSKEHGSAGTEVLVEVRGKRYPAIVSRMPFLQTKYHTS